MDNHQESTGKTTTVILGFGQFGLHALQQLKRQQKSPDEIVVVDNQPADDLISTGFSYIQKDCISWFTESFTPGSSISQIIPAVPVHVAAQWIKKKLEMSDTEVSRYPLEDRLLNTLPHPLRLDVSSAALSHADFTCPPYCNEPKETCTVTGKKRPEPLYNILEAVQCDEIVPVILRSRQFAPGVGGFFSEDLWNILRSVQAKPETPLLLGTACKCHGIIDGIYFTHSTS